MRRPATQVRYDWHEMDVPLFADDSLLSDYPMFLACTGMPHVRRARNDLHKINTDEPMATLPLEFTFAASSLEALRA